MANLYYAQVRTYLSKGILLLNIRLPIVWREEAHVWSYATVESLIFAETIYIIGHNNQKPYLSKEIKLIMI